MFKEEMFSVTIVALLLASMLTAAFSIQLAETTGTIYAGASGPTDPPRASSNNADGMNWSTSLGSVGTSNLGYPPSPIINTFTTVMSPNTTSWDTDFIGTPYVLFDSQAGLYKMWYSAMSDPVYVPPYWVYRYVIAYAESTDGVTWTNKTMFHNTGSGTYYTTGAPWVLKENGTYLMWHMDWYDLVGGQWSEYIALMSSSDGVNWPAFKSPSDQKVLSAQGQSNPQGDGRSVSEPWIIHTSGQGYTMWYSVTDYPVGPRKVWTTTSVNGASWLNRQLSLPYVPGSWEGTVSHPSVAKEEDGTYTMFYSAAYADYSNPSIGVARSLDGISWTNRTQLLRPSDLSANITSISEPSYFQDVDGKRYLYFTYYDGQTKFGRMQLVDWWPMFHHDLMHTGYSTSTAPISNQTLWKYTTGWWVSSSPAIVGGVVYVGSGDTNVYALNAKTGAVIWSCSTGDPVFSSPAVTDGRVYIGSGDMYTWSTNGRLYCLDALSGDLIWSFRPGSWVESSPAVAYGMVFVGSGDNYIYALNATTGGPIWSFRTNGWVVSSPAVVDGRVYVGSNDTSVYCLDAYTGAKYWSYPTDWYVTSSPAVVDGVVYVGSDDGNVYALNASDGQKIWNYPTWDWVESSPAVAEGVVYVGSDDWNVYALNASTGEYIWSYLTPGWVLSSPGVADGKVYAGSWNFTDWPNGHAPFYCWNASTGAFIWSYDTDATTIDGSPAIVDSIVYIGVNDPDDSVYAFGVHDVAVTNVTHRKTVVCQGFSANISVTVADQGGYNETFNVTARADAVGISGGLVGYWSFDQGSGTTALDNSGNHNDGTITGAHWTDGMYGHALSLDGSDDCIVVGDSATLNPSTALTISAWVFAKSYSGVGGGQRTIAERRFYGSDDSYQLVILPEGSGADGRVVFSVWSNNVESDLVSADVVPLDRWCHVAATYDGSSAKIYLNGTQNAAASISGNIDSTSLNTTIGVGCQGITNFFNGTIDEVRIYGRSLSAEEIAVIAAEDLVGTRIAIQKQTVTLESGTSTTLSFAWNTSGFAKGNYTISAVADTVPGETDTADNSFMDGWIVVSMVGDLTGGTPNVWDFVPDGKVSGADVSVVSRCFGSSPNTVSPMRWEPNCDLNNNGRVDGNDVAAVARHFGEAYP